MVTVRQRESQFVPTKWRTRHLSGHAATAVLGFAATCSFYSTVVRSNYRCYPYNALLMIHDASWEQYEAQIEESVWYKSESCYDTFAYALTAFCLSAVWMGMFETFGRGGTVSPEHNQARFLSHMVEQWRVVIWACAFNFWYWVKSLMMAIWFTDGYWKFTQTVSKVPEDDKFRNDFEMRAKSYYILTIVLLWLMHLSCTFNLALTFYRLASGVDFEIVFDGEVPEHSAIAVDLDDSAGPSTGPSSKIKHSEKLGKDTKP